MVSRVKCDPEAPALYKCRPKSAVTVQKGNGGRTQLQREQKQTGDVPEETPA